MSLKDLLTEKKGQIQKKWYHLILETYPPEAAAFFKKNRDQFENPVGAHLGEGVEGILSQLLGETDEDQVKHYIDRIVRIRAVQDFTPADAVRVFPLLKKAIREVLGEELEDLALLKEFLAFEEQIDEITLKAFEIYHSCRERLYHMKVEEWKSRMYMLLRKAGLLYDEREGSLPPQTNMMG